MNHSRLNTLRIVLALLPVALLWCLFFEYGLLNRAQDWTLDLRYRIRGELPPPAKIVYVDIDSISLDEIGNFPWSRGFFAVACQALIEEAGVKAIGIDVVLSDAGVAESVDMRKLVEGNRRLAGYLWNEPPVVLASAFSASMFRDDNGELFARKLPLVASELPPINEIEGPEVPRFLVGGEFPYTPAGTGLIDTEGGGTRRVPLYAPSNVRTYYHLTVELLRRYWDLGYEGVRVVGDGLEFVREDGAVVRRVPLADGQMLEVNWFSPWEAEVGEGETYLATENNPRFSFRDAYAAALFLESADPALVAKGRAFFDQEIFKGAIVLIGPTDALLQDLAPTPFDEAPVPKVSVHGNVLKTILAEAYIRRLDKLQVFAVVVGLTVLVVVLSIWSGRRTTLARALAGTALVGYVALTVYVFGHYNLVLPLVAPLGSALSSAFLAVGWQAIQEQKAKGRIKGMFGTYLAPEVVETMIESGRDPELGGHDAEITAYFSDIQNFSSFSEVLTSSQLGALLNEYLTACTDIVQAQGGTLDKYIGDAVVAMFGAPVALPDHAYRACVASQLVQLRLGELREKWTQEGGKWPELVHRMRTRVGLNTGVCMIGNMGSRTRFNYTMMGDNVNLAARMESGAKSWGVYTLVTDATRVACEAHGDRLVFRPLGRIVVKGRLQPVPIHEIVGLRERVTERTLACLAEFEQGLQRYYEQDWAGAAACFERSAKLEPLRPGAAPGVETNPSLVYGRIAAEMKASPPPRDWDGVYVMKEK